MSKNHEKYKAIGLSAATIALLGGSAMNGLFKSDDKLPEDPKAKGLSSASVPYELGSETDGGNKVDTMSEVSVLVAKNVAGEQGGIDAIARDIKSRTEANGGYNIDNVIWLPENADAARDIPGMQLVSQEPKK